MREKGEWMDKPDVVYPVIGYRISDGRSLRAFSFTRFNLIATRCTTYVPLLMPYGRPDIKHKERSLLRLHELANSIISIFNERASAAFVKLARSTTSSSENPCRQSLTFMGVRSLG